MHVASDWKDLTLSKSNYNFFQLWPHKEAPHVFQLQHPLHTSQLKGPHLYLGHGVIIFLIQHTCVKQRITMQIFYAIDSDSSKEKKQGIIISCLS